MLNAMLLLVSAAGLQATAVPDPQQGPPIIVETKRAGKKVCRTVDPPTGSRLGGGRVCRDAADWKMEEERAQRTIERGQQRERAMQAYNENAKNALASQGPP